MCTETGIKDVYRGVQGACPRRAVTHAGGTAKRSERRAVGMGLKLVDDYGWVGGSEEQVRCWKDGWGTSRDDSTCWWWTAITYVILRSTWCLGDFGACSSCGQFHYKLSPSTTIPDCQEGWWTVNANMDWAYPEPCFLYGAIWCQCQQSGQDTCTHDGTFPFVQPHHHQIWCHPFWVTHPEQCCCTPSWKVMSK